MVPIDPFSLGETGINILQLHRLNSSILSSASQQDPSRKQSADSQHLSSLPANKRIRVFKEQNRNSLMDSDLSLPAFGDHKTSFSSSSKELRHEIQKSDSISHLATRLANSSNFFHSKVFSSHGFLPSQVLDKPSI